MDVEEDQPELARKPRPGIYWLPNLFTTGAMFAGFYAIVTAMSGQFEAAAIAVYVAMVLDECLPYPVDRERAERSTARSVEWALRGLHQARTIRQRSDRWQGGVFAIQQGSLDRELRMARAWLKDQLAKK